VLEDRAETALPPDELLEPIMSNEAEALVAALPAADEPEDMAAAPILVGWRFFRFFRHQGEVGVEGTVYGSDKFPDASEIYTSALRAADPDRKWVLTQNTVYRLGPARKRDVADG